MWDDPPEGFEPWPITWLRVLGCATFVLVGIASIPVGLFGLAMMLPGLPIFLSGLFAISVFCFWWVHAVQLAPRFAVSFLVITLSLGVMVALIPPWLLHSREEARRTGFQQNLRRSAWHYQMLHHHGHSISDEPRVHSPNFSDLYPTHSLTYEIICEPFPDSITLTSHQRYPSYDP